MQIAEEIIPAGWRPKDVGTLVYAIAADKVLMIEKKRGHGAGKVNGPGGKLEAGETPIQCARREVQEEVGVRCGRLVLGAALRFHDTENGFDMLGYAFVCREFEGDPIETPEAKPFWAPLDAVPYARMWQDDELWLPLVLTGQRIRGDFIFADDTLVEHRMELVTAGKI